MQIHVTINLNLLKILQFTTTFSCQFLRFRYIRLPFSDVFKRKIDKIFKELPNVFGIAECILDVGCADYGTNHDRMI